MKPLACATIVLALLWALALEVWAGGTRVTASAGLRTFAAPLGGPPSSKPRAQVYWVPPHAHGRLYQHLPYAFVSGSGVIVLAPYPPYFVSPVVVVNAPYFCLLHGTGFVSRIGMLDHLAGAHKLPFRAAASICPEGADQCLFPLY